jgi:predicted nucleic acid-binding protein
LIAYLDASVIVPLIAEDAHSSRAEKLLSKHEPTILVSDFAAAEMASVIARRVRTDEITREQGESVFVTFDAWATRAATRVETVPTDITAAIAYLRRLDLALRAPDAIHIALAQRLNAMLFTFDAKMALAARKLGVGVQP